MKTKKTILLVIIATFTAGAAFASGNLKVKLVSNERDAAVVEITNSKIADYEIQLFDENSNLIYSMETEAPIEDLTKRYNLSGLEDGNYLYIVKTNLEKVTKHLAIEDGQVHVMDIRKTLSPYIYQQDDLVKVSYLNFENENIKMYVYSQNGKLLSENELGNEFAIHKGIRLSDLNPGTYELVLANDYDVYNHFVEID